MQGDRFRQDDGFPEFDLYLAKRVLGDKLPILKIVKHSFERSDLPFDSFGLVGLVKMGDILFQGSWGDVWMCSSMLFMICFRCSVLKDNSIFRICNDREKNGMR